MDYTAIKNEINDAKANYEAAVSRRSGVTVARERYRNILENNVANILGLIKVYEELQKTIDEKDAEIKRLNETLDEADAEYNELKKQMNAKKVKA